MIEPGGMTRVPYPDWQMDVSEGGEGFTSATDLGTPRDLDFLDRLIGSEGCGGVRAITDLGVADE